MNLFKIINIASFIIITIGIVWSLYDVGFIPSMMVMVTGAALLMISTINQLLSFAAKNKKLRLDVAHKERETLRLKTKLDEFENIENRKTTIENKQENEFTQIDNAKTVEELKQNLLSCICSDLNASVGTLFWSDQKMLQLSATFGITSEKIEIQQFEIGEGIIGQVGKDFEPIFMDEVPEGYLSATSGLGDATPSFILTYPLMGKGKQLLGVIEIGTFVKLESFEIDYLKTVNKKIISKLSKFK